MSINRNENELKNTNKSNSENIFDIERLKLSQNFHETVGVKKALLTVPVRKPSNQEFIRTHPDQAYCLETAVIELKEERETYLVDPNLWSEIAVEIVPMVLFTTINRQAVLTLWPIRLPDADGRHNVWHASALEAALLAKSKWIRVTANMYLGAYEVSVASDSIPEPEWPDIPFQEMLKTAFKDNFINDLNHPVLKKLRGEI